MSEYEFLGLTSEQKQIKESAKDFAKGEFLKYSTRCDENEEFPWELWKEACKHGFVGVFIDEKHGGQGLGYFENALIYEEFHKVDPACGFAVLCTVLGAETLLVNGSEDLKSIYLPPLPNGKAIMAIMITEPVAGSDVAGIQTTAKLEGGYWVINGTKTFVTNGTLADYAIVLCKTEDSGDRHRRFSTIMVDLKSDGVERRKLKGKLGMRASDTAEVSFENVHVPKENLMGERGKGFYHIMDFFNRSRTWVAAQGLGIAQGALEEALNYVKTREAFERPLSHFQAIQFKVAEMITEIEAARSLTYKACSALDSGKVLPELSAMAKWYSTEVAFKVVDQCLQLHGGIGYFSESKISKFYRDVRVIRIYEGATEIEKWIIGRRFLNVRGA